MADILDRVIDIAKKLRKVAKKSGDQAIQELITDLNLSLADLKVQVAEQRAADVATQQEAQTELAVDEDVASTPTATTTTDTARNSADSLQYIGRQHDSGTSPRPQS